MIVVRLTGGLGNQMFQYAAGRRLAHVLGTELELDISGFEDYPLRAYALGNLNIEEKFFQYDANWRGNSKQGIVSQIFRKVLRKKTVSHLKHVREKHFHFDPEILELKDNVFLEGYFQSERYFRDVEPIIRKEFVVRTPLSGTNRRIAEQVTGCESVSLHVRRGDYVSNPHSNRYHGVCKPAYYFRCMTYVTSHVKNPHFFVFSDDPQWVKTNLNLSYPTTFVTQNDLNKGCEDMRLMSLCRHHITANSTFSWWAAWLSINVGKIVVCPRNWFRGASHNDKDLIPGSWIRL